MKNHVRHFSLWPCPCGGMRATIGDKDDKVLAEVHLPPASIDSVITTLVEYQREQALLRGERSH